MYGARFFGDILGYNPLVEPNKHGNSGGFFSAGHRNRDIIWNWPSVDDRVHIVGNWVWDRGHSENGALTEIHPARLISIQRNLPSLIYDNGAPVPAFGLPIEENTKNGKLKTSELWTSYSARSSKIATRDYIFASADGGALWNNRNDVPDFVEKVNMNERDYTFRIFHNISAPSPTAKLKAVVVTRNGDTFPLKSLSSYIKVFRNGDSNTRTPFVTVTIPWKSLNVSNDKVFARTVYLYWDKGSLGGPSNYKFDSYVVSLEKIGVYDTSDTSNAVWAKIGGIVSGIGLGVLSFAFPVGFFVVAFGLLVAGTIIGGAFDFHLTPETLSLAIPGFAAGLFVGLGLRTSWDGADGEYRLFTEIGGNWIFNNEFTATRETAREDGVLEDNALGDVSAGDGGKRHFANAEGKYINFVVILPRDKHFRIHASGWERDYEDLMFGNLVDQNSVCDTGPAFSTLVSSKLVHSATDALSTGCANDPLGEVNELYDSFRANREATEENNRVRDDFQKFHDDIFYRNGEYYTKGFVSLPIDFFDLQPLMGSEEKFSGSAHFDYQVWY